MSGDVRDFPRGPSPQQRAEHEQMLERKRVDRAAELGISVEELKAEIAEEERRRDAR